MKKINNIKLLDCTLRDGGYYNNWNFQFNNIQKYLNNIATSGIKYIELGFRFNEEKKLKGLTAYTENKLLKKLKTPKKINLGIMINASDLIKKNKLEIAHLKKLIQKKNIHSIKFIRIACHHHEIEQLGKCISYLKKLKLKIFINIMQITELKLVNFKKILFFLKKHNIKNIYLADSLGALKPNKLIKLIKLINNSGKFEIGLHAHNNLKLALKNSIVAIKNGVNWIDCTITGMGRGPGNLKTEDILTYLNNYKKTKNFTKLKSYFESLKKIYKWGPNKYYRLAAINKIHPTYIQRILSDKRYNQIDYLRIIKSLSRSDTKKFSPNRLINSIYFKSKFKDTSKRLFDVKILKSRKVLIVGPGKNLKNNKIKIQKKIYKENYFVISLNTHKNIDQKFVNLRVSCHPFRLMSDKEYFNRLNCPLVLPLESLKYNFKLSIKNNLKNYFNYGLKIDEKKIKVNKSFCSLPYPLAVGYGLAIAISGKASVIKFAGFDGYEKSDPEHDQTEKILKSFRSKFFSGKFKSLTKTKYKNLSFRI